MGLSVILVDDHTMLRQGMRRALESEGIKVVGRGQRRRRGNRAGARAQARRRADGRVDARHRRRRSDPSDSSRPTAEQRVVMLTMHIDRDVIDRAIRPAPSATSPRTRRSARSSSRSNWQPTATGRCRHASPRQCSTRPVARTPSASLVPRGRGAATRRRRVGTNEIAERLFISGKTVKNHLASIYEKLNARDRTQAVLMAVKMGIVKLT